MTDLLYTAGLMVVIAALVLLIGFGAAWIIDTVITVDAAARWVAEALA